MQFIQPNGFQTPYGQPPYAYNTPNPTQPNGYPEIIGEGNVTSLMSPDGTTQFIFLPTAQWWRPFSPSPNINNPYLSDLGAWIVRSIYNPLPPAMSTQPYQPLYNVQYSRPSNSVCGFNLPPPGFQLKFHNDNCTSTSDLHYFTPKQCRLFQKPKEFATAQVEMAAATNANYHYGVICNNPCLCKNVTPCRCAAVNDGKQDVQNDKSVEPSKVSCKCGKKDKHKTIKCTCITSNSDMSIEESKSDNICDKVYKYCKKKNKARPLKTPNQISSSVNCNRSASDKIIATYTDQGTASEKCQRTQTYSSSMSLDSNCSTCEIKSHDGKQSNPTKLQRPKTSSRNDNIERSSQPPTPASKCDSGCCFGHCTCKKFTTELWLPATPTSKKDMISEGLCDNEWCSDSSGAEIE